MITQTEQRLTLSKTSIEGVLRVKSNEIVDTRGGLLRLYCRAELGQNWTDDIAQINHTFTRTAGTVRGMHAQRAPSLEQKMVRCTQGKIWDVAVDLRKGSATFMRWHAEILDAESQKALLLPKGVAHGYQALTDNVTMLYLHSSEHSREHEISVNPNDPALAIDWPMDVAMISEKDRNITFVDHEFDGIVV